MVIVLVVVVGIIITMLIAMVMARQSPLETRIVAKNKFCANEMATTCPTTIYTQTLGMRYLRAITARESVSSQSI